VKCITTNLSWFVGHQLEPLGCEFNTLTVAVNYQYSSTKYKCKAILYYL